MIPLSVPNISGNEWNYIKECLDTNWVSSVGSYVTAFEKKLAEYCGVKHAVATSNGTAALHISMMLAGVQQGDLVILPNITFVAPANAIKYIGADPLLVDVDPETWQMDIGLLEEMFETQTELSEKGCIHTSSGKRIAAIVPVHVLGNICDLDRLIKLAEKHKIPVVEDATESLGSFYKGKNAGSFGLFGCLSFNGNKIISTGGGGMILTNDEALGKKAKHLTTQAKADPEEYYHDEIGYNYRLVNLLAAMGVAQMEQLEKFLVRKKEITDTYNRYFEHIASARFQRIDKDVKPNNWLYTIYLKDQPQVRQHLKRSGIEVRPFWVPMNQLPAFKNSIYFSKNDHSNDIYTHCLSLPCSSGLTKEEQETVIEKLKEYYHD